MKFFGRQSPEQPTPEADPEAVELAGYYLTELRRVIGGVAVGEDATTVAMKEAAVQWLQRHIGEVPVAEGVQVIAQVAAYAPPGIIPQSLLEGPIKRHQEQAAVKRWALENRDDTLRRRVLDVSTVPQQAITEMLFYDPRLVREVSAGQERDIFPPDQWSRKLVFERLPEGFRVIQDQGAERRQGRFAGFADYNRGHWVFGLSSEGTRHNPGNPNLKQGGPIFYRSALTVSWETMSGDDFNIPDDAGYRSAQLLVGDIKVEGVSLFQALENTA